MATKFLVSTTSSESGNIVRRHIRQDIEGGKGPVEASRHQRLGHEVFRDPWLLLRTEPLALVLIFFFYYYDLGALPKHEQISFRVLEEGLGTKPMIADGTFNSCCTFTFLCMQKPDAFLP
jgi:hypothetical protein